MTYTSILAEARGAVGIITFNRPEVGNAYTQLMGEEVTDALLEFDDDPAIRAIVVTGAGRHFCAGVDMTPGSENRLGRLLRKVDGAEGQPSAHQEHHARPWVMATPVIAAINGAAIGIGLTLPLLWDIRVAAEDAKLGFVFTRRGVIPEANSTWILPRLIGASRALDVLLTGRVFSGAEAEAMGLVTRAVPAEAVLDVALEIARDISENTAPEAVTAAKRLIYENLMAQDRDASWLRETRVFDLLAQQPDAREAVLAFLEKRMPSWTGAKMASGDVQPNRRFDEPGIAWKNS
jgi:enoyl-CoA hydratase/carnithine racemase